MTDNEIRESWNFSKMVAINIGSVTLSKEDVLAIDDFINRQKAEIERLENSLAISKKETKRYVAQCQTIRSDAVKEFAERLKKTIHDSVYRYWNFGEGGYYLAEDVDEDINNLVKEFTEEKT